MFDKFPRSFQYFDCVMRFFPRICVTFSDLARDRLARYTRFLGICGTFKDFDRMLRWELPYFPTKS